MAPLSSHPAQDPTAPGDTLTRYANDESMEVRMMVAANPSTPATALFDLARVNSHEVKMAVAHNPATPLPLAEQIVIELVDRATRGQVTSSDVLEYAGSIAAKRKVSDDLFVALKKFEEEYTRSNP